MVLTSNASLFGFVSFVALVVHHNIDPLFMQNPVEVHGFRAVSTVDYHFVDVGKDFSDIVDDLHPGLGDPDAG